MQHHLHRHLVVGAGYNISEDAGDSATFVKLLRVAMLVPIMVVLSVKFRGDPGVGARRRIPTPLFVIGFVVLVFAGSAEVFLLAKALAARPVALVSRHRNTRDWHENCLEIAE